MSFWTLGANVVLWLKGGGWLFQSNPSIAKGLWTFHMMILLRWGMGSGLSSQPVDRLVKKALCRKSPILHAYYSSLLFHLDLPPCLWHKQRGKDKKGCVTSLWKRWCSELLLGEYLPRLNFHIWFPKAKWWLRSDKIFSDQLVDDSGCGNCSSLDHCS